MPPSFPTRTSTPSISVRSDATSPTITVAPRLPDTNLQGNSISTSSPCCRKSTPKAVVLDLHTTIVIPDFHLYYHTPISHFQPDYHALGDGSLVATPLIADIRSANIQLSLMSALAMFFLVTSVISMQYLRRGKIKTKVLFYILLASQVLGLVSILMVIIPFYNQFIDCTSVGFVVIIGAMLSYSLLMTGILGLKAYRCLNNSRFVLVILAILRTAMIILMILDLTGFTSSRRLSGSCMPAMNIKIMPVIIILQAAESAFICSCFMFAVWRTTRSSEQGRMSISLSFDDKINNSAVPSEHSDREAAPARRGWWDYVPERRPEPPTRRSTGRSTGPTGSQTDHSGIIQYVGSKLHDLWSYPPPSGGPTLHRKPSIPGEHPISQPPRTSSVSFSVRRPAQVGRASARFVDPPPNTQVVPPTSPSAMSRLSKYMPRMQLFKEVLKNELYYTALVTAIYVVIAILMLVGMSYRLAMNPVGWVCISWFTVSLFTMHSFGRVVRRHEREAILQHPTAWDPIYRAELEASRAFNRGRRGRTFSPVSVASRRPRRKYPLDPFEDPRLQAHDESVEALEAPEVDSNEGAGHSLGTRPWAVSRDFSLSSAMSSEESVDHIQVDRLYSQSSRWGEAEVLPSPAPSDCPFPPSTSACPGSPVSEAEHQAIVQPTTTRSGVSIHSTKSRTAI